MLPLDKDLQQKKSNLTEFYAVASRVLNYLPMIN